MPSAKDMVARMSDAEVADAQSRLDATEERLRRRIIATAAMRSARLGDAVKDALVWLEVGDTVKARDVLAEVAREEDL
jgi:hypothetical protein